MKSTEEIETSTAIVEQIIGQEKAVKTLRKAAKQRRNLLMIGPPGIGKSMIAKAYADLLGKRNTPDLLAYYNYENPHKPIIKYIKQGKGRDLIDQLNHEKKTYKTVVKRNWAEFILSFGLAFYQFFTGFSASLTLLGILVLIIFHSSKGSFIKIVDDTPELIMRGSEDARFIDATGFENSALFGDVLHDPFQSGGLQTPAHKRLIPGAVHQADQGVLYIDEVGTLSYDSQVKLLTVLQERKAPIIGRSKESVSSSVSTEPISADFALVLSGNMETINSIHPALRSRIQGYGYEIILDTCMPDTIENQHKIIQFIAQEVRNDGRIPHFSFDAAWKIVDIARLLANEKDALTLELRRLGGVVRSAGDFASLEGASLVQPHHVDLAKESPIQLENFFAARKYETRGLLIPSTNFMDMNFIQVEIYEKTDGKLEVVGADDLLNARINAIVTNSQGATILLTNNRALGANEIIPAILWGLKQNENNYLQIVLGSYENNCYRPGNSTLRQIDNVLSALKKKILPEEIVVVCPTELNSRFKNSKVKIAGDL